MIKTKLSRFLSFIGTKKFLYIVLSFFILQALWIAVSFRYSMVYDETYHFEAIELFSKQISPILNTQPRNYDDTGAFVHGGATLFHYALSFPFRFFEAARFNQMGTVISLRIICIFMAAYGLYLYARLFKKIGVRSDVTNIGILIYSLLPITTFVAATINYDNLQLIFVPLFLIKSLDIINSKKLLAKDVMLLAIIGIFGSLVKFTILPIVAFSIVFIVVLAYKKYGFKLFKGLYQSFINTPRLQKIILITALLIGLFFFLNIYAVNLIQYHTLEPSCEKIIGASRCTNDDVYLRDSSAMASISTRSNQGFLYYLGVWLMQMDDWTGVSGAPGVGMISSTPIMFLIFAIGAAVGFLSLYLDWRKRPQSMAWYFLLGIILFLSLVVFLDNYSSYNQLLMPYGIQPRYLIPIFPIFIILSANSLNSLLSGHFKIKLASLIVLLLLFTQGGGVLTHILRSNNDWYWYNFPSLYSFNNGLSGLVKQIVIWKDW